MPAPSLPLLSQIFSIPLEKGKYLVYAPLKGMAFIANPALVNAIAERCENDAATTLSSLVNTNTANTKHTDTNQTNAVANSTPARAENTKEKNPTTYLDVLEELGFFIPELPPKDEYAASGVNYDTVILFLTNQCNLRCSYCYASSGEFTPKAMSWDIAKAAIDKVMAAVIARGENNMTLGFHGGGEPTMNFKLLTKAVDYAKAAAAKAGLTLHLSGAFNGYWSEQVRTYMLEHFTEVSLSFDGLAEVQNNQRPAIGGKPSFGRVTKTLAALDKANEFGTSQVAYGIRMTVTQEHVPHLAASVEYICQNFRPAKIQAEPVFLEGRARKEQTVKDSAAFVEQFIAAHRIAEQYGIELFYSGARPDILTQRFCLAACRALVVTTDGDITTCFETYGKEHPLSARFIVGAYNAATGYELDKAKLDTHFARTANSISYCEGCFCRWHCAGDCSIKASMAGRVNEFKPTPRCDITQELTKYLILNKIKKSGGVIWQRNAAIASGSY